LVKRKKSLSGAELILAEIIPADVEPVECGFVFLFVMVYFLFEFVETAVEAEEEFLGIEEVD
jgi:hypothetical protein